MRKTMIYLDDDQFLMLKRVAASTRKKVSEIIREAVSAYLSEKGKVDYFSFVGIAEGPKNGRTSEEAEEVLREVLR
ncbi:MAG: ribbon-helix-helix domain-containing protein [Desulfotomaculales bacterium]